MGPGNFVWNELLTRDVEAAKRFYVAVLGWTFRPHETLGGTYWIAEKEGKAMAGLMAMPEHLPASVPAHWFAYVKVDNVDASVRRVIEEGGQALRPSFDVPEVGRLGIIADSTGAALGLLTPRRRG